jgi:hypothetical protein
MNEDHEVQGRENQKGGTRPGIPAQAEFAGSPETDPADETQQEGENEEYKRGGEMGVIVPVPNPPQEGQTETVTPHGGDQGE